MDTFCLQNDGSESDDGPVIAGVFSKRFAPLEQLEPITSIGNEERKAARRSPPVVLKRSRSGEHALVFVRMRRWNRFFCHARRSLSIFASNWKLFT